ncbi:MAG TPA: 3-phosphoshikimate 1-carboxyvinyltransferase [Cyclobacteriaceae bacterium]|nr:3-phosphoshikimate 1-carboxyvinyltransferase [Cyclobacteriaceae bacterium]
MSNSITVYKKSSLHGVIKNLPSSKSISNRAIIIDALAGGNSNLSNLSDANDTRLMRKLIASTDSLLDVEDAGTTMRFLTAYNAIQGQKKMITGTDRMKQRPIAILVDALRKLGAEIEYVEKEGFPPVKIPGFRGQLTSELSIRGDVSSQYISALMMVAPVLTKGLTLKFEGNVTSRPYIEMTASLMNQFGVQCKVLEKEVHIPHQPYKPTPVTIESDWSAASYWYGFTALAEQATVELPVMTMKSIQGDRVIVEMMEILGVKSEAKGSSLVLTKQDHQQEFSWDFKNCPDLAQTVAVVCAAKGIKGTFTGLESLRIKETDRILALQQELKKLGATFLEEGGKWVLTPSLNRQFKSLSFNTYLDHRMAMAFAPLATMTDVTIEDPAVTRKSYPKFWEDISGLDFKTIVT